MERRGLAIPKRRAQKPLFDLWVKLLFTLFVVPVALAPFVHWAITDPGWVQSVRTYPLINPIAVLGAPALCFVLYWCNYTKPYHV